MGPHRPYVPGKRRTGLPDVKALANQKQQGLVPLACPSGVYEAADTALLTDHQDILFLTSDARKREADMYMPLECGEKIHNPLSFPARICYNIMKSGDFFP